MQQETNEGASDSISRYSLNQLFEAKFDFMAAFFRTFDDHEYLALRQHSC